MKQRDIDIIEMILIRTGNKLYRKTDKGNTARYINVLNQIMCGTKDSEINDFMAAMAAVVGTVAAVPRENTSIESYITDFSEYAMAVSVVAREAMAKNA